MRVTRAILLLLTAFLGLASGRVVAGELRVVTTIPDLADIAGQIGGERIDVNSIAKGTANIHKVTIRPSTMIQVDKADLFIEMGLSLEHAYVPGLLQAARNPRIEPGSAGFVNCSEGWKPVEVPEQISRGLAADVHPQGNPHFNLDPAGGRHIAERILAGLVAVDPEGEAYYRERHAAYLAELAKAEERWKVLGAKLKGQKIVTYHREYSYFARRYGLEVVAHVEPKPGLPPTSKDLAQTIKLMKEEQVGLVLTAKWSNNRSVRFVAQKSGAKVLEVPTMVGGVKGVDSWIEMMDFLHVELVKALGIE